MTDSRKRYLTAFGVFCALSFTPAPGSGQAQGPPECGPQPIVHPACSYTALNGDCTITIDRLSPIVPPTIYVRRGKTVTVLVLNTSPFEKLSLDAKPASIQPPLDAFANGFTTLTTALGSLELAFPQSLSAAQAQPAAPPPANAAQAAAPPPPPPQPSDLEKILNDQKALLKDIQKADPTQGPGPDGPGNPAEPSLDEALRQIKAAEQPMPTNLCQQDAETKGPYLETPYWHLLVNNGLDAALRVVRTAVLTNFTLRINDIEQRIESLPGSATNVDGFAALKDNQSTLKGAVGTLAQLAAKLSALKDEAGQISGHLGEAMFQIIDSRPNDKNYQTEASDLNYTNRLADVAKRVSGTSYTDPEAALLAGLGDASTKKAIITITVQYESSNRYEISSGVLVPVTPYHSYTAAQSYTASAPVVQETKTYTIVPDASVNFLLGRELVAHRQRLAFFFTAAVGYTPATSSVAFGVGPSFSWRSIVLSPLADIGRDAKLGPGFTVNQPLGTSATPASTPLTTNVWDVKPALGLSVRIPLGGASQ